jgi:hypothetical protein
MGHACGRRQPPSKPSDRQSSCGLRCILFRTASRDNCVQQIKRLLLVYLAPRDASKPFPDVSMFNLLVMVVVVFPCRESSGRPFSMSLVCFVDLGGGGELRRTPVRRFCLLDGSGARPVRRREARRNDCLTSHCLFFASQNRMADPAVREVSVPSDGKRLAVTRTS